MQYLVTGVNGVTGTLHRFHHADKGCVICNGKSPTYTK